MTTILLKLFVKNYEDTKNNKVREKYGFLSGITGIVLNMALSFGKFIIGSISGSISITADALNNLSDAGSSIVTLLGFKLSTKKPDKDHPFGHGRYEYIAALVVSFFVLLMGFELIKSAVQKIINPSPVVFSIPALAVLVLSIAGKIWLAIFNRRLGKKIDSPAMMAVVTDSIGDIVATSVALFALVFSKFSSFNIDGYVGIVVALFVMYAGFGILKDTISPLLGEPPKKEEVDELVQFVLSFDEVKGIHDIILHNYGANRVFGSIHIEVPSNEDFSEMHDIADNIEQQTKEKFGIELVVHLDPLVFDDERIVALRKIAYNAVKEIDERIMIHDFRAVEGTTHTNLIFDAVVPFDLSIDESELKQSVEDKLPNDTVYHAVITVENSYT